MTKRAKVLSDRVIFRVYPDGEVIAILIDQVDAPGIVACYVHIGGHSTADYGRVVQGTRLATVADRRPLQRELRRIGYHPRVMKRWIRP